MNARLLSRTTAALLFVSAASVFRCAAPLKDVVGEHMEDRRTGVVEVAKQPKRGIDVKTIVPIPVPQEDVKQSEGYHGKLGKKEPIKIKSPFRPSP